MRPHPNRDLGVTYAPNVEAPMPRKLLAVLVSSAFLWTGMASAASPGAEPAKPAQTTASQSTGNNSPLPAGPARIKTAQGLEDDDIGPGVIIASLAAAVAVAFLVAFSGGDNDDDEGPPTTGTN
jgi:hypothetical protein